ncbi:hypothetical protein [Streptomyces sp. AS58]|nr:hypothetical protein [Streptomyces sp. AS58]
MERDTRVSPTVYDRPAPLRYLEVRWTATVTEDEGRELAAALVKQ